MNIDPDHVPASTFCSRCWATSTTRRSAMCRRRRPTITAASFIARGAAEETYAYYSVTQMASYALGFPIVTGCQHHHRAAALQQVGGFAAHDADDLLLTFLYRAAGWQGCTSRRSWLGADPVDWAGYLRQQRRWARSVLDIKFRLYPRLAGRFAAASGSASCTACTISRGSRQESE